MDGDSLVRPQDYLFASLMAKSYPVSEEPKLRRYSPGFNSDSGVMA